MSLSDRIVVMNAGCVEQVGTPEEIYAHPASLFVAGFVGQVNALPGRVVARPGSDVTIATLGQHLTLASERCPADDVLVLVRPEAIRVSVPPERESLQGVVEDVEYRGDRVEYRVRAHAILVTAVEASLQRRMRIAVGDRVGLTFVEQAVHLLAGTAGG
jgi:ABC-type Fe3+/spermidine/putrescine transport system ATPase subunit